MDSTRSPPHRKPKKTTLDTAHEPQAAMFRPSIIVPQEGIRDEEAILDLDSEFRSSHDP
jgi:hypothetical protein